MKIRFLLQTLITLAVIFVAAAAIADVQSLRGTLTLEEDSLEPDVKDYIKDQEPLSRDYLQQPPLIPHTIRGYEVNLNSNKCMACHSRQRTAESLAPMVSVTHYMDREGNFLAELSPRRYFCNQCHVNQTESKPLVENSFVDMHKLMKQKSQQQ